MKLKIDPFREDPSTEDSEENSPHSQPDDSVDRTRSDENQLICEVRESEARYNLRGERSLKEKGSTEPFDEESDQPCCAVDSSKYFDHHGDLETMRVVIYSKHIKQAMLAVIKEWPRSKLDSEYVILVGNNETETLACLFHFREELAAYGNTIKDTTSRLHIRLIIQFVKRELSGAIQRYHSNIESAPIPGVEFNDLWTIFKPGELIWHADRGSDVILPDAITECVDIEYQKASMTASAKWDVITRRVMFDGEAFGYHEHIFQIPRYSGTRNITELPHYPSKYHEDERTVQQRLATRGRMYCDFLTESYHAYNGDAMVVESPQIHQCSGQLELFYPQSKKKIKGRVVLDTLSFQEKRSDGDIRHCDEQELSREEFTDRHFLLCHYALPGFSLQEKEWCWFFVDNITKIRFDCDAYKFLLLPESQKRLLHALVTQHVFGKHDSFDDFIEGKGKGVVFLLHGDPGLGKTFTVEAVADYIQRPMYSVKGGDLGTTIQEVEANLTYTMDLIVRWNGILLLDEADTFLEERTSNDLLRNALVTVFLRALEYFPGIMFLTTNRAMTFDRAFQSRIHVALNYQQFGTNERKHLWKDFLKKANNIDETVTEDLLLAEFATPTLNGRQIKNIVRISNQLALSEGAPLSALQIRTTLQTVLEFDSVFGGVAQSSRPKAPAKPIHLRSS